MTKTRASKTSAAKRPSYTPRRLPIKPLAKSSYANTETITPDNAKPTKMISLVEQLRRGCGASLVEIAATTGWQHHSIRGAISGHIKKKLGLKVASTKDDEGVRRYRIAG